MQCTRASKLLLTPVPSASLHAPLRSPTQRNASPLKRRTACATRPSTRKPKDVVWLAGSLASLLAATFVAAVEGASVPLQELALSFTSAGAMALMGRPGDLSGCVVLLATLSGQTACC